MQRLEPNLRSIRLLQVLPATDTCFWCGENHNIGQCGRRLETLRCPNCQGKHRGDSRQCTYPKTVSMFERLDKGISRGVAWRRRILGKDADGFELVEPGKKGASSNSLPRVSQASNLGKNQSHLRDFFAPVQTENNSFLPDSEEGIRVTHKRARSSKFGSPGQDKRILSHKASPPPKLVLPVPGIAIVESYDLVIEQYSIHIICATLYSASSL